MHYYVIIYLNNYLIPLFLIYLYIRQFLYSLDMIDSIYYLLYLFYLIIFNIDYKKINSKKD